MQWWIALVIPGIAVAQETFGGPERYALATYAWVVALACLGGIVANAKRYVSGRPDRHWLPLLVYDVLGAVLSGLVTFWLCEFWTANRLLTVVLISISSHMGPRAFFIMVRLAKAAAAEK